MQVATEEMYRMALKVIDAKDTEIARLRAELAAYERLIANLEGEVRRLAGGG